MATFQKITPNLWFNNQAEEAVLQDLLVEPVTEKSERVMREIFNMKKLDIAILKKAYDEG
jgi:predicted 3-demethylubiquinone-9 3-methyltransferase (glyoxalase superfamily)